MHRLAVIFTSVRQRICSFATRSAARINTKTWYHLSSRLQPVVRNVPHYLPPSPSDAAGRLKSRYRHLTSCILTCNTPSATTDTLNRTVCTHPTLLYTPHPPSLPDVQQQDCNTPRCALPRSSAARPSRRVAGATQTRDPPIGKYSFCCSNASLPLSGGDLPSMHAAARRSLRTLRGLRICTGSSLGLAACARTSSSGGEGLRTRGGVSGSQRAVAAVSSGHARVPD